MNAAQQIANDRIGSKKRLVTTLMLLAALAAAIAPFWYVEIPPSTDLPQHLSQIFLLQETIAGRMPELSVTPWYYPNTLVYLPLLAFWKLTDPLTAGRMILSTLACSWVLASYHLARAYHRPLGNWLISIPVVFNFLFSWGLLNFLCGWPVFCLLMITEEKPHGRHRFLKLAALALLLYYAHALWFLMANAWLIAKQIDKREATWMKSSAALIPAWCCALVWYPQLSSLRRTSGVDTGASWDLMPFQRLDITYIADSSHGVLQGPLEKTFLLFVLIWIALSVISHWRNIESMIDHTLLMTALLFVLGFFALPWLFMNTIFFNQRWLPFGLTLLLIALPVPWHNRLVSRLFGIGWLGIFSAANVDAFMNWESEQLDGFKTAIYELKKEDKVFGINLLDGSLYVKGRPGMQIFSYAQALRGSGTNFSFTEHFSGMVQFKSPPAENRTRQFVFAPLMARREHLDGFNRVLVNGDESLHEFATTRLKLRQLSETNSTWRLYEPIQ